LENVPSNARKLIQIKSKSPSVQSSHDPFINQPNLPLRPNDAGPGWDSGHVDAGVVASAEWRHFDVVNKPV